MHGSLGYNYLAVIEITTPARCACPGGSAARAQAGAVADVRRGRRGAARGGDLARRRALRRAMAAGHEETRAAARGASLPDFFFASRDAVD